MKTVLPLLVFGLLISSSVAAIANRKARSSPIEEPFRNDGNTVTPVTTGVSNQDLQKLYEFFRVIAEAMEAQTTENISELDKDPIRDAIGQILNGTLEIETTTPDRTR